MQVGSLVVLVDDIWAIRREGFTYPEMGPYYTVREYEKTQEGYAITLEEIENGLIVYKTGIHELRFNAKRFREIQSPMDVSLLLEECMLETA